MVLIEKKGDTMKKALTFVINFVLCGIIAVTMVWLGIVASLACLASGIYADRLSDWLMKTAVKPHMLLINAFTKKKLTYEKAEELVMDYLF
jgi:hypothetical protein